MIFFHFFQKNKKFASFLLSTDFSVKDERRKVAFKPKKKMRAEKNEIEEIEERPRSAPKDWSETAMERMPVRGEDGEWGRNKRLPIAHRRIDVGDDKDRNRVESSSEEENDGDANGDVRTPSSSESSGSDDGEETGDQEHNFRSKKHNFRDETLNAFPVSDESAPAHNGGSWLAAAKAARAARLQVRFLFL